MLHLMKYRPVLAAAAGGAAAFADVAAAGGAHLAAAGEAKRGVCGAALLGLDQLDRAVRGPPGRKGLATGRVRLDRGSYQRSFGIMRRLDGGGLGKFLGIRVVTQAGRVV